MSDTVMDETVTFPVMRGAHAAFSDDRKSLLVEAEADNGEPVRFAIDLADVQHFVAFLLIWAAKMEGSGPRPAGTGNPTHLKCRPVPATSVAIGQPEGGEGYLGISVGSTDLLFALPISAFDSIGRTLLTMSAQAPDSGPA